MEYFKTTLNNSNTDEITTDGNSLYIVDNSNYINYSDKAQGGSSTTIILASTESSWNGFFEGAEFKIIAGTGVGQGGVCTSYNGTTKEATIATTFSPVPDDTSIYEASEVGHLKSYFTDFRQILITNPDNTTALLQAPSIALPYNATLPITDTYAFTTGDGVYKVQLASVPTWSATVEYKNITAPYVFYQGSLYRNLQDSLNDAPNASATIWELVGDWSDLSSKYLYTARIAVYCGILDCYISSVFVAASKMDCWGCNSEAFMRDTYVQKASKLSLAVNSIQILASVSQPDWTKVSDIINFAKNICCKCQ